VKLTLFLENKEQELARAHERYVELEQRLEIEKSKLLREINEHKKMFAASRREIESCEETCNRLENENAELRHRLRCIVRRQLD
jgi:peptidoglycan hydrolase CwlO-like protein